MPRRRPVRVWPERVTSAIESMVPGTLGGRVSSAAPIVDDDIAATIGGEAGVLDLSTSASDAVDEFDLASDGAQTVTLTYLPINDECIHVELNGLEQRQGTDWTRADAVISLLAAMDPRSGDRVDVHYRYRFGAPVAPTEEPSGVSETWYGYNPGTNWNPFTFGDSLEPTDLCLVATVGTGSTTPSGRGTWSKIVNETTPNRTFDVWLGYDFDNSGTSITFAAGVLGGATAYRIITQNAQTTLPANSSAPGSDAFNPASMTTGSLTPAVGDVVFAFLASDSGPEDVSTRTDTGTTLGTEVVRGIAGTVLATAAGIATAAVSSHTSWAIIAPSDWWGAVLVKVTPA
jgi:hypothetical protein